MSNHDTGHGADDNELVAHTPGALPDRFEDPGHPEHHDRMGDTDPKANKRAERQVVVLFAISVLATIGFLIAYFALPPGETADSMLRSNLALGLGLALSLLGIGLAAVHWAKALMNDHEKSEDRHQLRSSDKDREAAVEVLKEGAADSAIGRRGVLQGAMISALALFPLAIVVPIVGNAGGEWNVGAFRHTFWRKGRKLMTDPSNRPIKAADVTIGSVFHVIPEGINESENPLNEKAKAVVLLVRLDPADLKEAEDRKGWSYDGIVAYSKICTHVGCPVALYEQQTHHLLCPCHQSTFDVADGAKVVFGPAKRPLPQLPITVDDEGYLIAQSDFTEPIGPSYWERLK
ncbi:cytochrome bc1 complex Rieske iron-sulfur subunit [Cellulomonas fengjieae]|uniref:cytochrome bc1 complex Rieske iron-sulfur subunit n=1 Tax=Cellulomonas fengjieae TaxID=2819978 RepID=UPI003558CDB0